MAGPPSPTIDFALNRIRSFSPLNVAAHMFASSGIGSVNAAAGLVDTVRFEDRASSDTTEYPVESGSNIADHKQQRPTGMRILGVVSSRAADAPERVKSALRTLNTGIDANDLQSAPSAQIVRVVTPTETYGNCVVTGYTTTFDNRDASGSRFTITLRQVVVSDVEAGVGALSALGPTPLVQFNIRVDDLSLSGPTISELIAQQTDRLAFTFQQYSANSVPAQSALSSGNLPIEVLRAQEEVITSYGEDGIDNITRTFTPELRQALSDVRNDQRFGELSAIEKLELAQRPGDVTAFTTEILNPLPTDSGASASLLLGLEKDGRVVDTVNVVFDLRRSPFSQDPFGRTFSWQIRVYINNANRAREDIRAGYPARPEIPLLALSDIVDGAAVFELRDNSSSEFRGRGRGAWIVIYDRHGDVFRPSNSDAFTGPNRTHTIVFTNNKIRARSLFAGN